MAAGGIYDHVGGGFHRYSTDAQWLVPHFEKMLYDNALLASAYVEASGATGNDDFRRVAAGTLDYVLREMTDPAGAFYATQDADSEGVEGKFYVWSNADIDAALGDDAPLFGRVYGVTAGGNFEGHTILHRVEPDGEHRDRLAAGLAKLYDARSRRVRPGRDEKIVAAWNGLMISAFAAAGAAFAEPRYAAAADRAADFVLKHLRREDGRLMRTCLVGQTPKTLGCLDDYACLLDALVTLYEATFDAGRLRTALDLAADAIRLFAAPDGGFYTVGADHEALIARTKDGTDGSTPSGNATLATAFLRLAALTGRNDLRDRAGGVLRTFAGQMADSPGGSGQFLAALDLWLGPVEEVVVLGPRDGARRGGCCGPCGRGSAEPRGRVPRPGRRAGPGGRRDAVRGAVADRRGDDVRVRGADVPRAARRGRRGGGVFPRGATGVIGVAATSSVRAASVGERATLADARGPDGTALMPRRPARSRPRPGRNRRPATPARRTTPPPTRPAIAP